MADLHIHNNWMRPLFLKSDNFIITGGSLNLSLWIVYPKIKEKNTFFMISEFYVTIFSYNNNIILLIIFPVDNFESRMGRFSFPL